MARAIHERAVLPNTVTRGDQLICSAETWWWILSGSVAKNQSRPRPPRSLSRTPSSNTVVMSGFGTPSPVPSPVTRGRPSPPVRWQNLLASSGVAGETTSCPPRPARGPTPEPTGGINDATLPLPAQRQRGGGPVRRHADRQPQPPRGRAGGQAADADVRQPARLSTARGKVGKGGPRPRQAPRQNGRHRPGAAEPAPEGGEVAGSRRRAEEGHPAGRQLRRPHPRRRRAGARAEGDLPVLLLEAADHHADAPRRPGTHSRCFAQGDRLGNRAGCRHRQEMP